MATNVDQRTNLTWSIDSSSDWGASWTFFQNQTGSRWYRNLKPDPVSTIPVGGAYVLPTGYHAFLFAASGSDAAAQTKANNYAPSSQYRRRNNMKPQTNLTGLEGYGCTNLVPAIPTSVSSQCRNRLLGAIRNQAWDLGTSLVELPSSIDEMGNLVEKARQKIVPINKFGKEARTKYSSKSASALRKIPGAAASGYLTMLFGILPIMNDIYQLLEKVSDGLGNGHVSVTIEQPDPSFELPANTSTKEYSGSVKRGIKESATLAIVSQPAFDAWRLGLTNPIHLGYQLVSLSFVLDWFTHFGSFLAAMSGPHGVVYRSGYSSRWLEMSCQYTDHLGPSGCLYKGCLVVDSPMTLHVTQKAFKRDVLYGIVPPLPFVDLGLNIGQVTTAIALLVSNFR